ncbi:hypothetical protein B0H65DRAFT_407703, partial [Neurospora tetraspora]
KKCWVKECSFAGSKGDVNLHLKDVHKFVECTEAACEYVGPNKDAIYSHGRHFHTGKMKCTFAGCDWEGTTGYFTDYHKDQHGPIYKCPERNCPFKQSPTLLAIHVRYKHRRADFTVELARKCGVVEQANNDGESERGISDDADDAHAADDDMDSG